MVGRFQTNLPVFKLRDSSVRRRYSDFEWLRNELERDSKVSTTTTSTSLRNFVVVFCFDYPPPLCQCVYHDVQICQCVYVQIIVPPIYLINSDHCTTNVLYILYYKGNI